MPVVDNKRNNSMVIHDLDEEEVENVVVNEEVYQNPLFYNNEAKADKRKGKEVT